MYHPVHGNSIFSIPRSQLTLALRRVFVCYNCENFLVGIGCFQHHCKQCVLATQNNGHNISVLSFCGMARSSPPSPSLNLQWADCTQCEQQRSLLGAKYPVLRSSAIVLIRWSRLLVALKCKQVATAPWRQAASKPCIADIGVHPTALCVTFL